MARQRIGPTLQSLDEIEIIEIEEEQQPNQSLVIKYKARIITVLLVIGLLILAVFLFLLRYAYLGSDQVLGNQVKPDWVLTGDDSVMYILEGHQKTYIESPLTIEFDQTWNILVYTCEVQVVEVVGLEFYSLNTHELITVNDNQALSQWVIVKAVSPRNRLVVKTNADHCNFQWTSARTQDYFWNHFDILN